MNHRSIYNRIVSRQRRGIPGIEPEGLQIWHCRQNTCKEFGVRIVHAEFVFNAMFYEFEEKDFEFSDMFQELW